MNENNNNENNSMIDKQISLLLLSNYITNNDKISVKRTAALDFSIAKIMLIIIYPHIELPGNKSEVQHATLIQLIPPQNL